MNDIELRVRGILGMLPLEDRLRNAEDTIARHDEVVQKVPVLLAELERLRTENAALREVVTAVATEDWLAYHGDAGDDIRCPGCGGEEADWREEPKDLNPGARYDWRWQHYHHTADCPVTKARTLLSNPKADRPD